MGHHGTRRGKHIYCAGCRQSAAAYNFAYKHQLPRPKVTICSRCRHKRYVRYNERDWQRRYKQRVRKAKAA